MSSPPPILHMFCGKIAAGKSTLAAQLAASDNAVLIAEDDWLSALYPDEMSTISDFMRCSSKLRGIMAPHVASILKSGTSVVLDFQANTLKSRDWMRGILQQTNTDHRLHVLDVPDEICLARLHARNALAEHPFAATEEHFHQISKHFAAPTAAEGFNIVIHTDNRTA